MIPGFFLLIFFFTSGLIKKMYSQLCAIVKNDLKSCHKLYIWAIAVFICNYSKDVTLENERVTLYILVNLPGNYSKDGFCL